MTREYGKPIPKKSARNLLDAAQGSTDSVVESNQRVIDSHKIRKFLLRLPGKVHLRSPLYSPLMGIDTRRRILVDEAEREVAHQMVEPTKNFQEVVGKLHDQMQTVIQAEATPVYARGLQEEQSANRALQMLLDEADPQSALHRYNGETSNAQEAIITAGKKAFGESGELQRRKVEEIHEAGKSTYSEAEKDMHVANRTIINAVTSAEIAARKETFNPQEAEKLVITSDERSKIKDWIKKHIARADNISTQVDRLVNKLVALANHPGAPGDTVVLLDEVLPYTSNERFKNPISGTDPRYILVRALQAVQKATEADNDNTTTIKPDDVSSIRRWASERLFSPLRVDTQNNGEVDSLVKVLVKATGNESREALQAKLLEVLPLGMPIPARDSRYPLIKALMTVGQETTTDDTADTTIKREDAHRLRNWTNAHRNEPGVDAIVTRLTAGETTGTDVEKLNKVLEFAIPARDSRYSLVKELQAIQAAVEADNQMGKKISQSDVVAIAYWAKKHLDEPAVQVLVQKLIAKETDNASVSDKIDRVLSYGRLDIPVRDSRYSLVQTLQEIKSTIDKESRIPKTEIESILTWAKQHMDIPEVRMYIAKFGDIPLDNIINNVAGKTRDFAIGPRTSGSEYAIFKALQIAKEVCEPLDKKVDEEKEKLRQKESRLRIERLSNRFLRTELQTTKTNLEVALRRLGIGIRAVGSGLGWGVTATGLVGAAEYTTVAFISIADAGILHSAFVIPIVSLFGLPLAPIGISILGIGGITLGIRTGVKAWKLSHSKKNNL